MVWRVGLMAALSFLAAMINAVAGGGTFITFPALTGIVGLSEKAANITSTIGLWPGSASSIVPALPDLRELPRWMIAVFSIICLAGGAVGALLLIYTSAASFKLVIPWLLLTATMIFAFSKPIARWAGRGHGSGHSTAWTVAVCFVQFFIAIYGGYFGAGVGVLTMAGLSFVGLHDVRQMNALKVVLSTLINLVAMLIFLFSNDVNWPMAGVMAGVSLVGGVVGMGVARRMRPTYLRAFIIAVGTTLTVAFFWQNYR